MKRFFILALILFFTGCTGQPKQSEQPKEPEKTKEPEKLRVISMSPNLTQIIYAIDADEFLVGVDDFSDYPEEAKTLPRMGSLMDPNVEAIVNAKPDIVFVLFTDENLKEILTGLRIPYREFVNDTVGSIENSIREMGEITGKTENSRALIQKMLDTMFDLTLKLENVKRPKVAIVVGRNPGKLQDIVVCGGTNFLGELINMAGGQNVFAEMPSPWPSVGIESLIAYDPDIIIDTNLPEGSDDAARDAFLSDWKSLSKLSAVKNNKVIVTKRKWFLVPGAHIGETLKLLAHWIHPDLYPDPVNDPFYPDQPTY